MGDALVCAKQQYIAVRWHCRNDVCSIGLQGSVERQFETPDDAIGWLDGRLDQLAGENRASSFGVSRSFQANIAARDGR